MKILPILNEKGFDVIAPSLPGYGFSSYPEKAGFRHDHHAEVFHKLMYDVLGYKNGYVVQGGDWGHYIARCVAILYPEHCRAVHLNMVGKGLYFCPIAVLPSSSLFKHHKDKSLTTIVRHA